MLRAKYAFCLNYFCPLLKTRLEPDRLKTLLAVVGRELAAGWELEQAIDRRLQKKMRKTPHIKG